MFRQNGLSNNGLLASALLLAAILAVGEAGGAGGGGGGGGGGPTNPPNPFTFTDLTNQTISTQVPEGGTTLTGMNAAKTASISIAGAGCQMNVSGTGWGSAATTIQGNGSFDVRVTSSGSYSTTVTCTVTIDGVIASWNVTTQAAPPAAGGGGGGGGPVPPLPAPPSGLAAGCVVGGTYESGSSGFVDTNYGFSSATVNASGAVQLSLTTNPLARTIKVPFDQQVYAAYVDSSNDYQQYYYETSYWGIWKSTYQDTFISAYLGWFVKPLVESEYLAQNGANLAAPISYYDLWTVDQTYVGGGGKKLLNYAFPYIYDYDQNGVLDWMNDPTLYGESGGWGWIWVWFNGTWVTPTSESDYTANNYLVTGDGVLDGKDTRVLLGRFKAGTEIAFFSANNWFGADTTIYTPYDTVNSSYWSRQYADLLLQPLPDGNYPACSSSGAGLSGKTKYDLLHFQTVTEGSFKVNSLYLSFDLTKVAPESVSDLVSGSPVYTNGPDCGNVVYTYKGSGGTAYPFTWTQGLFTTNEMNALQNRFGLSFSGTVDAGIVQNRWAGDAFDYTNPGNKLDYPHILFVSPDKDPFTRVMAMEANLGVDYGRWEWTDPATGITYWWESNYYTDADYNDYVYLLETRAGGTVQMATTASPSASLTASQFVTSGTIKVVDVMPAASCSATAGDSRIDYYMSSDGGNEWVHIDEWDVVRDTNSTGTKLKGWSAGTTETTYREATVNFLNLGLIGNRLLWKADLITANKGCLPSISKVDLSYNASGVRSFSHTSPVTLANIMYDAEFSWSNAYVDQMFRGHLYSKRLYDPANPTGGYSLLTNWDAGSRMGGSASVNSGVVPTARNIRTGDMTVTKVTGEVAVITSGSINGVNQTFTAKVANPNILAGSVTITGVDTAGRRETFTDSGMRLLVGSLAGTGRINREAGVFTVRFTKPLGSGTKITADYSHYKLNSQNTVAFNTLNMNAAKLGLNDNWYWTNTGAKSDYDMDGNGTYNAVSDASWLVNWVQGYRTPVSTVKEWFLGAIDHSSPAVVGAPGLQGWYYGSDVTDDDRESFDQFRCLERKRSTYMYVGSRSGMLHSFYAGEFRPYYVDESLLAAPFTCDFSNKTNLNKFRGDFSNPSDTGAINPNGPVYPAPGGANLDISRGYYEWPNVSGPNYGTGNEVFSVIPPNQVNRLKNAPLKTEDKAFMDASPAAAHVRFSDGTWHTVIIVAQGNGGDSVMAVDVSIPTAPKILWEYADPDMYRSRSAPSVGSVGRVAAGGNSNWVVMFVSGVNADANAYPAVYMLEVETGDLLYRLELNTDTEALGSTPSGQPAMIDSDGNGYVDRFFIGTDKGVVFKGIMPDNPTAATGASFGVCTFYKTDVGAVSGERLGVYASPSVTSTNTISATGALEFKVNVFFGTSSAPYHSDEPVDTYYFYTLRDTDDKSSCTYADTLWKLALPAGHQVYTAAFATANRVYFGTSTATSEDPCAPVAAAASGDTGNIYVYQVEPVAGAPAELAKFDSGNTSSSLSVDDEHLYFRTSDGRITARGGKRFQNETKQGGFSEAVIISWSEVLR